MATGFQRRNATPILMDIPTFDDVGRSAYVDYTQSPVAMAMTSAADAPDEELPPETAPLAPNGPVPVPPAAVSPEAYQQRAQADIQRMEALAERQRRSANNPLNVVGSILGGVVGMPFSFLENAIGGGQNDLTAPFRPHQNAQERYQAALAAIGQRRNEVETTMAGLRAGQAQAINTALTSQSERMGDVRSRAAILARNAAMSSNPQAVYAAGMSDMLADPVLGPTARQMGLAGLPWSQDLAYRLSTSEDTVNRLDEAAKPVVMNVTENGVGVLVDPRTGQPILTVGQGLTSQPVYVPPPAVAPQAAPAAANPGPAAPSSARTPQDLANAGVPASAIPTGSPLAAPSAPAVPDMSGFTDAQLEALIQSRQGAQ